jgi:hypothetical protein
MPTGLFVFGDKVVKERNFLPLRNLLCTLVILMFLPFIVNGDIYWSSTTNRQHGNEQNTSIVQIEPMRGSFKPICSFSSAQYHEMPISYDSDLKNILFYDSLNWALRYFTVKLVSRGDVTADNNDQLQLPTCDQFLAPIKVVSLPNALIVNDPVILGMYNEGNTNNLIVVSQYSRGTPFWFLGVFRFSLTSSSVTLLTTVTSEQPTSKSSPFGPLAYNAQENTLAVISYRSTKPYPIVRLTTFAISKNVTKTVTVPLLINWDGGRLMSSIIYHDDTQKVYGLWNIGTGPDARLIAIDPNTGDYVERLRSAELARCYLGFEPNVNLGRELLLLLCGDSHLSNLFYSQFLLSGNKLLQNPTFSLGSNVYPNKLIKVA